MRKILLINGSPHKEGCTYTALREVETTLNRHGVETELIWIGNAPIAGCLGCGKCRELGHCVYSDLVNQVGAKLDDCGGVVIGSPVYYAGPAGQLCCFLDRLFYSQGSAKLAGKLGAAVVSCRRGGASAAFDRLNKYFTISNMYQVGSQYWNQVHGSCPEQVLQDEEGLQTMRTLGENIAWLLKASDAANEAGVPKQVYEPKTPTNFIR